jgi:DNA-binding CsgD family transcriptional regulator/cell division protein FtsB
LKAISLAEHYGNKYIQMKSSLGLAQLYQQNNEWKQSALYYREYALLHDNLLNSQKALQIAGIHLKYEYAEKENEMKLLKKESELARKHTTLLVISSIACIAILVSFAVIILLRYRSVNQKKKINELETTRLKEKLKVEEELLKLQKDKHDFDIEQKNRELATSALQVSSKNEILIKIKKLSENQKKNVVSPDIFNNQLNNIVDENLKLDEGWSKFKLHFEKVHPDFFSKLKEIVPDLTENELRLCAYIRINLRIKEIAQMLYISDDAVKTTRYRIKRKFRLDNTANLEDFIRNM